jgi:penicillin-binding protein 2
MYTTRARILAIGSLVMLAVIVARLASLQLGSSRAIQERITQLKDQRGRSKLLKTTRGRILDRKGRVLAQDEAFFKLRISYSLSRYLDERVRSGLRLAALHSRKNPEKALEAANAVIDANAALLEDVVSRCSQFGDPCEVMRQRIERFNDWMWNQKAFQAWRKHCTQSDFYKKNAARLLSVDLRSAMEDFERTIPDPNSRLLLTAGMDIAEMKGSSPLADLKTDNDFVAAQLVFANVEGISITPEPLRVYPYKTAAAQTIGWVGEATQKKDLQLFADDPYACYQPGDDCGREDGVEYVCEATLRGRRGKEVYDIDDTLSRRVDSRLGQDIRLTLDAELQEKIEQLMLSDHPNHCGPGMAAVVIDVASGDVLAMVSLPSYDLNEARYHYEALATDANQPLVNRVLNRHYPPGSVVKPIILVAGLQAGPIRPDQIISCPLQRAPQGWPSCWIFRQEGKCHDNLWRENGGNTARNAIKGSCNIYFSHLAAMIEPRTIQEWAFAFGYGRQAEFDSPGNGDPNAPSSSRRFRQYCGQISTRMEYGSQVKTLDQIPALDRGDRVLVGIGEGKFSATPIQVVGAMAALARGGVYKRPRLFLPADPNQGDGSATTDRGINLGLTEETLQVVLDGLHAVVNETGGTANDGFRTDPALLQSLRIYGKTGSTERPDMAWFGGFARSPRSGRTIALALVLEGGKSGGKDAAPMARKIITLCVETGYPDP